MVVEKTKDNVILLPYKLCYGCFACMNTCPVRAIEMDNNKTGFYQPVIDNYKCIKCKKCSALCKEIHDVTLVEPMATLACASTDETIRLKSTSGGLFYEIARWVINNSGIVYGCAYNTGNIEHIRIDKTEELLKLQGSKYVQSKIGWSFKNVEQDLKSGLYVLFSGTPCQVGALKTYLNHDYKKLITIDLFCHGIPSQKIFWEYISWLENKHHDKVRKFDFRGKYAGWTESFRAEFVNKKEIIGPALRSSYYRLFLDSLINNSTCKTCKYKNIKRCGDISLGDCWGIDKLDDIELQNGVSSVFVNSEVGKKVILELYYHGRIKKREMDKSFFQNNNQAALGLCVEKPSSIDVMSILNKNGYKGLDRIYQEKYSNQIFRNRVANFIPKRLKQKIKTLINR